MTATGTARTAAPVALRRLVLAGGGTAGHVYPALAVLREVSAETLWIGSHDGLEAPIVRSAEIRFSGIDAGAVVGRDPVGLAGSAWRNLRGFLSARRQIAGFGPDVVLGTGGYVSVPAVLAARSLGLPTALFLPDVQPGLAVRALSRVVDRIACTTGESRAFLPARKVVATGYPVRSELRAWGERADGRLAGRSVLGLPQDGRVLLVIGGSRGARSLNQAVWSGLERLADAAVVIHMTGPAFLDEALRQRQALPANLQDRYRPYDFIRDELGASMAAADVIVCRAGASVLGELPAMGLPAVLIPGSFAGGHQRHNASFLERRGAAVTLTDHTLADPGALEKAVLSLLADDARLASMRVAARSLDRADAARLIAEMLAGLARRGAR